MSSQFLTKRQVAVAAVISGLSAFVLFQNCAKAKFDLPQNLSSAQVAAQFCERGEAQPCDDQVGSGTRCVLNVEETPPPPPPEEVANSFLKMLQSVSQINVCLYDVCKPGFRLQDYQCVPENSECVPGECPMPNGMGYRFCGGPMPKLDPSIAAPPVPGQCVPVACHEGHLNTGLACVPMPIPLPKAHGSK